MFPFISLAADAVLAPEEMGSKRKGWVRIPGDDESWLFKYSRLSAGVVTGEAWAEKVGAELAGLLGLPHARVELATLAGDLGCISRRFDELAQRGTELVHGNDLLAGMVTGYEKDKARKQSEHTLDNILTAVSRVITDAGRQNESMTNLAGYVVLDALILKTDRHHENWALLRTIEADGAVLHRIAPTFDHASSLARNEPSERVSEWLKEVWRPVWYANRAPGAIYLRPGDKSGANPLQLAKISARKWPAYFRPWLEQLRAIPFGACQEIVAHIPDAVMHNSHKRFATRLLEFTYNELISIR